MTSTRRQSISDQAVFNDKGSFRQIAWIIEADEIKIREAFPEKYDGEYPVVSVVLCSDLNYSVPYSYDKVDRIAGLMQQMVEVTSEGKSFPIEGI